MGLRTNGFSDQWVVGPMGFRTNGSSDQWVVGLSTWHQRECYSDSSASKELGMLRLIAKRALAQTFPNVEVVLRLYLCMMVCNCNGERTFSHLKLIKSALRSTIRQQRLNCLALMSIECDVLRKITSYQ